MAKQVINIGASPNDGTGDFVRDAFDKTNDNFTELYDGKQDDLISGTNIKTINGDSVLGSGDLVISGGGSGGGAGGVHILTKPISGWLYTNLFGTYQGPTSVSNTLNFGWYSLFCPAYDLTISEASLNVTTAAAGTANVKIIIYEDNDYGFPRTKIIESTPMSANSTGLKTFITSYTFEAGKRYWLGFAVDVSDSTLRLMGINNSVLYTRNFNQNIVNTGMYIVHPFASPPAIHNSAATGSSSVSVAVYLKAV